MPELLTYPWDSLYPSNSNDGFFGATAESPNMPTDAVITKGFGNVTDGGFNWQQSGIDPYGNVDLAYAREWSNNNIARGWGYRRESTSSLNYYAWFDVGAGGGLSSGQTLPETAKSSYMKNVTACWFLSSSNASSDNTTANTRYNIRQTAVRYINPRSRRIVLFTCPTVLAGLTYDTNRSGGSGPSINGYELAEASKDIVELDELLFIGFRIGVYIGKDSTPRSLTTQVGISAITPGFLDSTQNYNKDNKRIICRNSQTTFTEYENETKFPIECR